MPLEEALAAYGHVHALGDQVLLGMSAVYEAMPAAVVAEAR